jgi:hypothetical protein
MRRRGSNIPDPAATIETRKQLMGRLVKVAELFQPAAFRRKRAALSFLATSSAFISSLRYFIYMQVVDPSDQLRRLRALDVQVEYETFLPAALQHALQLQLRARIDLLMRTYGGT